MKEIKKKVHISLGHGIDGARALRWCHLSAIACHIGNCTVFSTVCLGIKNSKSLRHLLFVRGIDRWCVDSPYKNAATQKILPCHYVFKSTDKFFNSNVRNIHIFSDIIISSFLWKLKLAWYSAILGNDFIDTLAYLEIQCYSLFRFIRQCTVLKISISQHILKSFKEAVDWCIDNQLQLEYSTIRGVLF